MFKLQTRIGLIFAAVLLSLLMVTGVTAWANHGAQRDQRRIEAQYMPQLEAAREMGAIASDMLAGHVILLKDPASLDRQQGYLEAQRRSFERAWTRSAQLAHTDAERKEIARIDHAFQGMVQAQERLLTRLRAGKRFEATSRHADEASPPVVELRRGTSALYHLKRTELAALRDAALERGDRAVSFSLVATVLSIGLAFWLWRGATRDLVEPLLALRRGADEVALLRFAKVHHPRAARTVELAALEADFNAMAERLAEAGARLSEANASLEGQVADRTLQLRNANARLEQAIVELKTLDRLKSDFMAVMSHELLTPINFIVGFGSALEDELLGPLNPAQRETVVKLLDGADRLTRMVRNTLEYTQLAAGKLEVRLDDVDLAAVIREAATAAQPILAARNQSLVLDLPASLPEAHADPDRTRQVLAELLDNAAKFSPRGARLSLSAETGPGNLNITITDPGIGIADAALPHLFEPFYQADATSTRTHGGMGLGLPIAYQLVAKMGGTLLVSSTAGRGTSVRVTLPLAAENRAESYQAWTKTSSHS